MGKTSNSALKANIFENLAIELKKYGFSFLRVKDRFVHKQEGITNIFQLVFLDGKPGYRIQPHIGVRFEQVENIFHQTSGYQLKYQKDTVSIGSSVGLLLTGDSRSCEFYVGSESEVSIAIEKIVGVFREFALPFFERWDSLKAIDAELNDKPSERTHLRPLAWERCSTGIIVAKLVGRGDYDQLAGFYTQVMMQDNKGFYFKRFQELLETLESACE